jgi:hypothetical protein
VDLADFALHVAVSAGSAIAAVAGAAFVLGGKLQAIKSKAEAAEQKAEAADKRAAKVEADLDVKVKEDNEFLRDLNFTLGQISSSIDMMEKGQGPRKSRPGPM